MTPKERMAAAMRKETPDRVPAMCQLSLGHYFLRAGLPPVDLWFTSAGFAEALLRLRERYGFDGVLVNLPGRDPTWKEDVARIDETPEGQIVSWKDGASTTFPRDDSPRHQPLRSRPVRADFAFFKPEDLDRIDDFPLYAWGVYHVPVLRGKKPGLLTEVPPSMLSTLDEVIRRAGAEVSVHAEVFSPFTHFMELFGYEAALMGLADDPARGEAILDRLSAAPEALALAYAARGADAILVSSAFAGAGFISRKYYERFVLPFERRLIRSIKAARPGLPVYTHTCGAIGDRLDLMEATGLDGIDTLDPPPLGTVELEEAKRRLGTRVFLKGNVDSVNTLLRKDRAGCEEDLRRTLAAGKPGGAYIFSTACSVAPRVEPDRLTLFRELAEREGRYP
jgi:uroporphyrinogen-III decarboxylase